MKDHHLIIGGTSGIGGDAVKALAQKGGRVSAVARRKPGPNGPGFSGQVTFWARDIRDRENTSQMLDDIISTNGLINTLIFFQRHRGKEDEWRGEIDTSLEAAAHIIAHMRDKFSNSGERNILFISSVASRFVACEQGPGYHVAKAGMVQMAKYYAVVLGRQNIRVNVISPAMVLKASARGFYEKNRELAGLYESITPLKRMGQPADITHLIEFLISPKASYITGQEIVVDGGLTLQMQASLGRDILNKIQGK